MPTHIALVGGDEFTEGCEEMDSSILAMTGVTNPSLVVIPTAAAQENPSKAAANGVDYFSRLGAKASPLMVLATTDANNSTLISEVDSADIIYFTGGNPSHLLDTLNDTLLLFKLRKALERKAVIVGSSAGAMVMGSWIRTTIWREALALAPGVAILPHHEHSFPEVVAHNLTKDSTPNLTILGIEARTACLGGPNHWMVTGTGRVTAYRQGTWRHFMPGEVFTTEEGA